MFATIIALFFAIFTVNTNVNDVNPATYAPIGAVHGAAEANDGAVVGAAPVHVQTMDKGPVPGQGQGKAYAPKDEPQSMGKDQGQGYGQGYGLMFAGWTVLLPLVWSVRKHGLGNSTLQEGVRLCQDVEDAFGAVTSRPDPSLWDRATIPARLTRRALDFLRSVEIGGSFAIPVTLLNGGDYEDEPEAWFPRD